MTRTVTPQPAPAAPPELVHEQFDDYAQQRESARLGMWAFLATEVLFFGALIVAYTMYRMTYPDAWERASHEMHTVLGTINTAILLTSSLTMALAVKAGQLGRRRPAMVLLVMTAVLGCGFLGVKGFEYSLEIREHKFPLLGFVAEPPSAAEQAATPGSPATSLPRSAIPTPQSQIPPAAGHEQLFYCFYWAMTGVHTLHMVVGVGILLTITGILRSSKTPTAWVPTIENAGLYWHFVDVVWVFLYPLLYLVGHS